MLKPEFNLQQFIFSLEKKYPVSDWKINGIHIWPILRVKLQTKINSQLKNNLTRKSSVYNATNKHSKLSKIKNIFSSFFIFYSLKKVDFVATSNFSHLSIHKGKIYNKFYVPIFDDVNSNGIIIEHNSKNFPKKKPLYNPIKPFNFENFSTYIEYYYSILIKLNLFNPVKNTELKEYNSFLNDLKKVPVNNDMEIDFKVNNLKSIVLKIHIYSKVYKRILKKTKPKFTFQICHYSVNSIALSIASKQLNITSVEIQHGGQPNQHMGYSEWHNVPKNGYNTLPKIYWNWNQESINNQQNWINKNKFHHNILLGNPWIDYIKKHTNQEEKKYILYSLQPFKFDLLFPDYLVDYIKNNNKVWWMRIHPTDVNRTEEYIEFFKRKEINDLVIFDKGNKSSLPETLLKSIIHVTYSSGTVIEAEEFGVKSLIIDEEQGDDLYKNQIKRGSAFTINKDNFKERLEFSIKNINAFSNNSKTYLSCFKDLNQFK
jgi:hypothetical protein